MIRVWLHGAGLSPAMWDADRARGLRPDLPGHGSRARAAHPTVAAFALALLPDLPARFDLIGHSLGGQVAMQIAATAPGRVRRLVLVDTAITTQDSALHRAGSALALRLIRLLPRPALVWLVPVRQRGLARAVLRAGLTAVDRAALNDAVRAATTFDAGPILPSITAPVLVIVGRDNRITHAQGGDMARLIPDAGMQILPGGHLLPMDDPAAFYTCVDSFLKDAE